MYVLVILFGGLYFYIKDIRQCCCVNIQVKYDLTKAVTGDDDKETIHCEFDVAGSGIEWLPGQICLHFVIFLSQLKTIFCQI